MEHVGAHPARAGVLARKKTSCGHTARVQKLLLRKLEDLLLPSARFDSLAGCVDDVCRVLCARSASATAACEVPARDTRTLALRVSEKVAVRRPAR